MSTSSEAITVDAFSPAELTAHQGVWLRSRKWDLTFLILSAVLVPIPLLLFHGLGMSQMAVNVVVAAVVGGPHLYSTFTYTVMEPNYRRHHARFLLGSLLMPIAVIALAFTSMQILLTIFYTWASIHVLHQITYINDCYAAKAPVVRRFRDKLIDYGVVFTCLYPLAVPQILDRRFQLGDMQLYVPEWATQGFVADAQIFGAFAIFLSFFALWLNKNVRQWQAGELNLPSVLLISLTIFVGFTLPLMPNIDVAFQGFNAWHSIQYLALIWFLGAMRKERGELGNGLVGGANGWDRPLAFYGLCLAITVCAGLAVVAIHTITGLDWQKSYYVVILSTLLQHYYLDHLQFTKLGDALGHGDRLIAPEPARS
ncbi:MAG TPA: hypothetical protein VGO97_00970 [Solirubrobacterales bacterium]|nr:hypothetical protein [Solirubrobacterales bacterium]